MTARGTALALCASVALLAPGARAQSAFETFGTDAASKGLAGARTATGGGSSAAWHNPAAMTLVDGTELSATFSLSLPAASFQFSSPPSEELTPAPLQSYTGLAWGGTVELGGVLRDRVWVGAFLYQPTSTFTHARAPDPQVPFIYRYDSATDSLQASPAVAVRFFDWLRMGVGLRVGGAQVGRLDMAVDPLVGRVTKQEIDAEQIPYNTPTAGVLVGPLGLGDFTFNLGFTYREHAAFPMGFVSRLLVEGLDADFIVPVSMITNFSPRTFNLGAAFTAWGDLDVALDLAYVAWSLAPSPYVNVQLYTRGEGIDELGLGGALDSPRPGQSRIRPAGFSDTLNVRAGVEYRLFDGLLAVRGGYSWRPSPVPDQTSGTNIADATVHVIAAGAGVTAPVPLFDGPVDINVNWQTHVFEPRRTQKEDASDPVGSWTLFGSVSELGVGAAYRF